MKINRTKYSWEYKTFIYLEKMINVIIKNTNKILVNYIYFIYKILVIF